MTETKGRLVIGRRLLLRLALVSALLFLALRIWPNMRHDTDILYDLGTEHETIVELRVEYLYQGQEHHGAIFRYPSGAPAQLRHRVGLAYGDYQVKVEVRRQNKGIKTFVRSLRVPADTVVRINAKQ
ncbi:MAG: hypothetical protein JXA30_19420 [Deltaproteobacteria bacterium]|nr:hypothetical protein [Deltaproteobacteria bacterium]